MVGDWLVAVGSSWRLVVGRSWRFEAVGGWWQLAVAGWWSLGVVLNKKNLVPKRSPCCQPAPVRDKIRDSIVLGQKLASEPEFPIWLGKGAGVMG